MMTPDDRPAAMICLLIGFAAIFFFYWIAAQCAAIYRERPVVIRNTKTGKLEVKRDLRRSK